MSERIDPRTCRPAGDAVSEAHRAEARYWVRHALNRVRPAEVAALLADILGLNEGPPRDPGRCACGNTMPIPGPHASTRRAYNRSQCTACASVDQPAKPAPQANERTYETGVRPGQVYAGGTATCPYCHRTYQLRGDGRLRIHPAWGRRAQANVRLRVDCPGSRRYPDDDRATT